MWLDKLQSNFEHKIKNGQIILKTCPFCQNNKFNIEFSIERKVWHCWVCNESGRVSTFFKLVGLGDADDDWKITNDKDAYQEKDELDISEFSLIKHTEYPKILSAKGIDEKDIKKYNLLYSDKGKFKDRLIIPLYEGTKLVYALARELTIKGKYKNFKIEKTEVLPYYLGIKNKYEIYLVEGAFDAISINKLGFTAGVLLGSHITEGQIAKIKRFGFDTAVMCLDGDIKKKAVKLYDLIGKAGVKTKIVLFDGKDDPNDLFVRDKAVLKRYLLDARKLSFDERVKVTVDGNY